MELIERLLFGSESLWGGGVAHSVLILALVVALGVMLGKLKVAGVSLGVTGILFVGIGFSYFGMNVDEHLMHFLKEFGLILFVYSIGLQVGPGFFSSFRKGGVTLNKLAVLVVALGVATTVALYYITGLSMTTMVGVMSGAVTNTPGLGAAQQAFSDMHAGADAPDIATGYAVAYPLGVVGAILTLIGLRYLLRIDVKREEAAAGQDSDAQKDLTTRRLSVEIVNAAVNGKTVADVLDMPIEEAATFFKAYPSISRYLDTLVQVGLGYIRLGQPAPTLSGGESQRVKLATELQRRSTGKTVYILDEPTTGLHFEDVRKLLLVLQGLVDKGNTVIVIEHNLDVVKSADWIIDLGPEGGDGGGTIVTQGTPEQVAQCEASWTGKFLKDML